MHFVAALAWFFLVVQCSNADNCPQIKCETSCPGRVLYDMEGCPTCECLSLMGDLLLTPRLVDWVRHQGTGLPNGRAGSVTERWNNDQVNAFYRVPYYYSTDIEERSVHKANINKALSVVAAITCIKFEPTTYGDTDKIEFIVGSGCYSSVGRNGGHQTISIDDGCQSVGTILHEVMHALGFWHEQSRNDRDNYVTVLFQNIQQGRDYNFFKKDEAEIITFGSPYDMKSIMHYGSHDFSSNEQPTIVVAGTASEPVSTQGKMLSKEDQIQLRSMYSCGNTRGIPETTDCMHPLDRGVSYRGTVSQTTSGFTCQRWDSQSPHTHKYTPGHITGAGLEENYCRNPDVDDRPWCFTTEPSKSWEFCDISMCNPAVPPLEEPKPLESIRGFWTPFTDWSTCSATCGSGSQTRTRHCIGSSAGSETCPGEYWERKACTVSTPCTGGGGGNGMWSDWSQWSECDAACGQGTRYQIRVCTGGTCDGDVVKEGSYSNQDCPLYKGGDCYDPNDISGYRGTISTAKKGKTCINWADSKTNPAQYPNDDLTKNYCRNPKKNIKGPYCHISRKKTKPCKIPTCQNQDALWSAYGDWSSCSNSCGGGFKYRIRNCDNGFITQGSCDRDVIESTECNTNECGDIAITDPPVTQPPPTVPTPVGGVACVVLGDPQSYRGTAHTTYKGVECQHWDSMYPREHTYNTLEAFLAAGLSENYCRAPDDDAEWPWCYALSYGVAKQPCDVPQCSPEPAEPVPPTGCFNSNDRRGYRGSISQTVTGVECQRWDLNTPHAHTTYKPYRILNEGLGRHNYCRNPDNDIKPWCVTTNPSKFWEYCDIPSC